MMNQTGFCPLAKNEKLLLATDRSPYSEGAVREAMNLAKRCGSRLYIMSVLESNPEYETIGASAYEKEEQEAATYLQELKARALEEGVPFCETTLHFGEETCQSIVDEACVRNADTLIIGRRGRSSLVNVLMGGVAKRVISHAPCKVLVVPRAARIEYRNILIATDGSEHSIAAAAEAIGIAKRCGSRIIALSSVKRQENVDEARANVEKVVKDAQNEGLAAERLTPAGTAHDVIVETAGGMGVDLIVMGTYGRTGLRKLLMGSATERVLSQANCAILVVRAVKATREVCAVKQAA